MHGTTRSRPDPLRAFTGSGCGYARLTTRSVRSARNYFKGESSGVAAVSGSSSGGAGTSSKKALNVLFTKRRSIIAPKSRDNYPYILNVRHLRYIFWLFNSKLYGIRKTPNLNTSEHDTEITSMPSLSLSCTSRR